MFAKLSEKLLFLTPWSLLFFSNETLINIRTTVDPILLEVKSLKCTLLAVTRKGNTKIDNIHENFAKCRKSWPKFMVEVFIKISIFDFIIKTSLFRSSRSEVFCKKDVLKDFAKFTGKHLCESFFLKSLQLYYKRDFGTSVFPFCTHRKQLKFKGFLLFLRGIKWEH